MISNGTARDYGGHGLYADEGSHGIRFRNNTVVHTSHAAIHVHRASRLSFEDSRLFDFGEAAVRCSRSADPEPVVFRDTVAAAKGVPFRGPYCDEPQYEFVNPVAIGAD